MKTQIIQPTPENIKKAADAILRNEIVGMPTETVYGLAGNCWSPLALARIFETKERPTFDPLIIHVGLLKDGLRELEEMRLIDVDQLTPQEREQVSKLIHHFWPGPLTLVLPKHPSIPDLATSGLPTLALRMPRHPVAQALIQAAKTPLAAPSANRFGRISPTTAEAVKEELDHRIEWILEGGQSTIGVESTIIGIHPENQIQILRHGGTSQEKIEEVLGIPLQSVTVPSGKGGKEGKPLAPGMLESHYAPRTPFYLLPKGLSHLEKAHRERILALTQQTSPSQKVGLLLFSAPEKIEIQAISNLIQRDIHIEILSATGDLIEAARNLFSHMRTLDSVQLPVIFSEPCQIKHGLGHAISDRLKRASALQSF